MSCHITDAAFCSVAALRTVQRRATIEVNVGRGTRVQNLSHHKSRIQDFVSEHSLAKPPRQTSQATATMPHTVLESTLAVGRGWILAVGGDRVDIR